MLDDAFPLYSETYGIYKISEFRITVYVNLFYLAVLSFYITLS